MSLAVCVCGMWVAQVACPGRDISHPALKERGSSLWALFRFTWPLLGIALYWKKHALKVHSGPNNQNGTGLELNTTSSEGRPSCRACSPFTQCVEEEMDVGR